MWEFRRNPQELSAAEKAKLETLFAQLPRLRTLYEFRVRFQRIFDTAPDRRKALRSLTELWLDMLDDGPELEPFIRTFETWQEEILNYFDARQTSGPLIICGALAMALGISFISPLSIRVLTAAGRRVPAPQLAPG